MTQSLCDLFARTFRVVSLCEPWRLHCWSRLRQRLHVAVGLTADGRLVAPRPLRLLARGGGPCGAPPPGQQSRRTGR